MTNAERRGRDVCDHEPAAAPAQSQDQSLGCGVCGDGETQPLINLPSMPVFSNVLHETTAAAERAVRADIDLRVCHGCGYIYNAGFDARLVEYAPAYDNALHYSPRFRAYAEALAGRLVRRLELRGKRVIEIGCGDGYFLRLLCRAGGNTGVGYDPAYSGRADEPGVAFRREYYGLGEARGDHEAGDLVCCRQVLEHIPQPVHFLRQLRRTLGGASRSWLFFEVPDAERIFAGDGIWDVLYEHCGYFLPSALTEAFRRSAFAPGRPWKTFGGQYLCILAEPAAGADSPNRQRGLPAKLREAIMAYPRRLAGQVQRWRRVLEHARLRGQRCVLWGAGSKGATILNLLEGSGDLAGHVVDISPRKWGRYIPGSAQRVVAPKELPGIAPSVVIVMNPLYRREVERTLKELAISAQVLAA